jgi:hypothetical protein
MFSGVSVEVSMKRVVIALALCAAAGGCQRDPQYTLPKPAAPTVRLIQATPGTMDLGGDADELCVLQSIGQYSAALDASVTTPAMPPADAGVDDASDSTSTLSSDAAAPSGPIAQVDLYFDTTTGTWHLASSGPVSATVACAPWSAFGGPQALTRFDNGGGNTYPFGGYTSPSASQTIGTGGATDCFLSDVEGDFIADGNGASIDGSAFTVSNPAPKGDAIYASATCFGGGQSVAFQDFPVDAVSGATSVAVLASDRALCGLSALGSLTQSGSSLVVSDGHAVAFYAFGVVRCFLFDSADAQ